VKGVAMTSASQVMIVPVDVVAKTTVPVYLDYVGTTEAVRQVTLQAKVSGYILSRGAIDGASCCGRQPGS